MQIENIVRKLDFITLLIFNTICEEGSLSRAAEKNMIALSAASKRLTDLEHAIGSKLFIRDSQGMKITPAGESLHYHSRMIIESIYKASIELDEYKAGLKGFVRLQANLAAIIQFLPEELNAFIEENPQIKLELEQHTSVDVIKNIQNRTADLGICVDDFHQPDLVYHLYRTDELVMVVQSQNYLDTHNIQTLEDALQYDLIGLQAQSSINQKLKQKAESIGQTLKLRMLVASFDALCRMVQAGMGIGIIPKKVYEIIGQPLGLISLSIHEPWALRHLYLVSKPDEFLNPVSLVLKQHLLTCAAQHHP
ncbi:LysR family transcriptional regulator [Acinetobacter sp. MB5]|uniref:LysR family transcriptional regulator n=1 Tax=Acinetobacter sp. MB5 TaxID=2069438 RepID=UPI000DD0C609|nr:LysR family transcriptional regulator [Acinetobacter sp. MB5]